MLRLLGILKEVLEGGVGARVSFPRKVGKEVTGGVWGNGGNRGNYTSLRDIL